MNTFNKLKQTTLILLSLSILFPTLTMAGPRLPHLIKSMGSREIRAEERGMQERRNALMAREISRVAMSVGASNPFGLDGTLSRMSLLGSLTELAGQKVAPTVLFPIDPLILTPADDGAGGAIKSLDPALASTAQFKITDGVATVPVTVQLKNNTPTTAENIGSALDELRQSMLMIGAAPATSLVTQPFDSIKPLDENASAQGIKFGTEAGLMVFQQPIDKNGNLTDAANKLLDTVNAKSRPGDYYVAIGSPQATAALKLALTAVPSAQIKTINIPTGSSLAQPMSTGMDAGATINGEMAALQIVHRPNLSDFSGNDAPQALGDLPMPS